MKSKKISFFLNGERTTYNGNPSAKLLDVLRGEYKLTGTKCGCKEGECGACSVILNGKLINSCLVAMGSVEGLDVLTIEGYSKTKQFEALEKAYASVSAVQCGFCIPGMILASGCLLSKNPKPSETDIREAISGNICRCTGYNAIIKAIKIAAPSFNDITAINNPNLNDSGTGRHIISLRDALELLKNPDLIPYTGGTDLMVSEDSGEIKYLYLRNIPELKQIIQDDDYIRFGAACTFTEVINHKLTPSVLKEACRSVAAPAIRNAGSIGGNIANGSAKADSALIFMVTDSKLRIMSAGSERIIAIKDFYLGSKKLNISPGELITEILMPKTGLDNYYFKKVGARNALSIARTSFAGIFDLQNGVINNLAVAFGAVIDTIIRFEHIDKILIGKTIDEAKNLKPEYLAKYDEEIVPRPGRVGVEYRKNVCMNLLKDFLESNGL